MLPHQCAHYRVPDRCGPSGAFMPRLSSAPPNFQSSSPMRTKRVHEGEIDEPGCWTGSPSSKAEREHWTARSPAQDVLTPEDRRNGSCAALVRSLHVTRRDQSSVSCTLIQCAGYTDAGEAHAGWSASLRPRFRLASERTSVHPSAEAGFCVPCLRCFPWLQPFGRWHATPWPFARPLCAGGV